MGVDLTFSVGVDVDSLWHYYRIHGLDESQASDHAWSHGVPRFVELFKQLGIPATFYCVAEDIERSPHCLKQLRALSQNGFEIGNHSWQHPYALTQLPLAQASLEITEGKRRLEEASQSVVSGFRAPGYHTHALFREVLLQSGHLYESSAFPCVPYYMAKAMVMGGMRLVGRKSQSILGSPRLLTAPKQPYLASLESPYRQIKSKQNDEADVQLVHYPISVWAGLPLIGTLFALLGPSLSTRLGRMVAWRLKSSNRKSKHLTIEFHAADLLALLEDELDPLLKVQPDLRRGLNHKKQAFSGFLSAIKQVARPVRLDEHPFTVNGSQK